MAQIISDKRLAFGALPRNMLIRSKLKPLARLLWGVLDSCGKEKVDPTLNEICDRMGFSRRSKGSVITYAVDLVRDGFLEVSSGLNRRVKVGKGFKWDKNVYYLTLPDYCFIDSPEILQMAQNAPIRANKQGWAPALGPDRGRARRQRWRQKARSGPGSASPDATGSASPDATGSASPDATGSASPDATLDLNSSLKEPLGTAPHVEFHNAAKTPAGWEIWGTLFFERYQRRHIWTRKALQAAQAINDLLTITRADKSLDPAELLQVQKKFLIDPYWSERGAPLQALRDHLSDYVPAQRIEKSKICDHQPHLALKFESVRDEEKGRPGHRDVYSYSCGHQIRGIFHADPTLEEQLQIEKFEQLRRKKIESQAHA